MINKHLISIFFIFILSACSNGDKNNSSVIYPLAEAIPAQGTRILGLDIKETPSVTYASAYEQAVNIGVREVSLSLNWKLLEPDIGNYDNTLAALIDSFYPLQTADFTLVLRPLDTPGPSLPSGLSGQTYDDPDVINAFENFLSNLHAQMPNLNTSGKLKWIQVGNEIDAYLGSDAVKWLQWQVFFNAAKIKIKSLWGSSVQVSSIIQFSTLTDNNKLPLYLNLLPDLDNASLTYYPLNADFTMRPPSTVANDFDFMVKTIPNKNILLQECGYPSSPVNNSSETLQAEFISAVFKAWDKHSSRIHFIDLTWQYDVSANQVDQWVIDFSMTGNTNENTFRGYLGTLGLNNYDSTEKLALQRLRDELLARKWLQ